MALDYHGIKRCDKCDDGTRATVSLFHHDATREDLCTEHRAVVDLNDAYEILIPKGGEI